MDPFESIRIAGRMALFIKRIQHRICRTRSTLLPPITEPLRINASLVAHEPINTELPDEYSFHTNDEGRKWIIFN